MSLSELWEYIQCGLIVKVIVENVFCKCKKLNSTHFTIYKGTQSHVHAMVQRGQVMLKIKLSLKILE